MLSFVASVVFGWTATFQIVYPSSLFTLAARFVCSILMHLQVESDIRQGLRMMKFSSNHDSQFSAPGSAFMIGFLQALAGVLCEVSCLLYLASIDTPVDVIIRFIAMGSIAKVDDFFAGGLPDENRIKGKSKAMPVTVHRRDIVLMKRTLPQHFKRFVYKTMRIVYASFLFYFLPFAALFIPYIATA